VSSFNAADLLAEVSVDEPCGADMEYDSLFQEMERASEGKEAQEMGDSVKAAEPPDWRTVKKNAIEILASSKDLRAVAYLTQAALHTEGWTGFASGLQAVEGLIKTYWTDFHPNLDPDDNNDPIMRVNIIGSLGNEDGALGSCQHITIVEAKGVGAFSKRDMDIASGEVSLPANYEGEPPSAAIIEAAFMQIELEELQSTADAIKAASDAVEGINTAIAEHIPLTETPDLNALSKFLTQVLGGINEILQRRGVIVEGSVVEGDEATAEQQGGISGSVQNREDVVRVLDQICEFYRRSEPSSPVPILLMRARKLVNMDFMDIMRTLTPGGLGEAENIRGPDDT